MVCVGFFEEGEVVAVRHFGGCCYGSIVVLVIAIAVLVVVVVVVDVGVVVVGSWVKSSRDGGARPNDAMHAGLHKSSQAEGF